MSTFSQSEDLDTGAQPAALGARISRFVDYGVSVFYVLLSVRSRSQFSSHRGSTSSSPE